MSSLLFAAIAAVFAFMTFSAQAMPAAPLQGVSKHRPGDPGARRLRAGTGGAARTAAAIGTALAPLSRTKAVSTRLWPGSSGPRFLRT